VKGIGEFALFYHCRIVKFTITLKNDYKARVASWTEVPPKERELHTCMYIETPHMKRGSFSGFTFFYRPKRSSSSENLEILRM
jgi:hypothetical protein